MLDYNIFGNLEYCRSFVEEIEDILLYSHIPIAIIAVFVGLFVYFKDRKSLLSRLLLGISGAFFFWTFLDLSIWFNFDKASVLMFSWALIETFSILIFILSLYFVSVFTQGKDISLVKKFIYLGLLFPVLILSSGTNNLTHYDLQECVAVENLTYLSYVLYLKIFLSLWLVGHIGSHLIKTKPEQRKSLYVLSVGILSFLFSFLIAGEISQWTGNYTFELYGLFGMLVFIACLGYLIVKFKTFNIRVLGAQVLVLSLVVLIASQYTFIQERTAIFLNSFTVFLSIIFSYILVRGVKREIQQREHIQKLALDLEKANVRLKELDNLKSEFLSFASHQIRSPLTAIKGYTSMILEGDFGKTDDKITSAIKTIDTSTQSLIVIVNEFLDISRIEQGRMKYDYEDFDACMLVETVVEELRPNVEQKGLKFSFNKDAGPHFVHADKGKIKQVIGNLIDNAIKYTPEGFVEVNLTKTKENILINIKDSGIGIDSQTIDKLFSKFSRAKDAHKTNVSGTGLGLYVAKQMIEAQKGKVWAESEGKGKGSSFIIELPLKK
jgi:signal transduction histidine kinase